MFISSMQRRRGAHFHFAIRSAKTTFSDMLAGIFLLSTASLVDASTHSNQTPAFLFEPMLDTYFDGQSGLIAFHGNGYDLAFPPDEPLQAVMAVVDDTDTVVQGFPFRTQYANRTDNGAIARAMMDGTAEITLTEPGVYNIVFMIDGALVSRLPVVLERVQTGDDPFEAETHYRYFGLWQRYAYLSMNTWRGKDWPTLTFWAGMRDFAEESHRLPFLVELHRDGELVAHSRPTEGTVPFEHYQRLESRLYHPHDRKSASNAEPFLAADWSVDGDYTVTVSRQTDGQPIRRFAYTAVDGGIQRLDEARIGFEPAIDYRPARVRDKSSPGYEFVDAIWISTPD